MLRFLIKKNSTHFLHALMHLLPWFSDIFSIFEINIYLFSSLSNIPFGQEHLPTLLLIKVLNFEFSMMLALFFIKFVNKPESEIIAFKV